MSFLPTASFATFAHQAVLGRGGTRRKKRRKAKAKRATKARSQKVRARGKPRPGTKAWMAYIRGKRGKKKR